MNRSIMYLYLCNMYLCNNYTAEELLQMHVVWKYHIKKPL